MDRTIISTPLQVGRVGLLALGAGLGIVLALVTPATGGLLGPGVIAAAFVLAALTGLAKTSSA